MRLATTRWVSLFFVLGLATAAQAAYVTSSLSGPSTPISQGSYAYFSNTVTLHDPGTYFFGFYQESLVWFGDESTPWPSATWNYGDGGTASGSFSYYSSWNMPATSTSGHTYYTPGTYYVSESGVMNTAYENSDFDAYATSPGIGRYGFNAGRSLTVLNVAPQNATVYQNGSSSAVTIYEGQSITRQMSARDLGYESLTFTVNGQYAGTVSGSPGSYRYSSTAAQTYTQDTNGSYVSTGSNQVSDGYGGFTGVAASYRVLNVAPTVYSLTLNGTNGNISVPEGTFITAAMSAYDPGADALTFYANGVYAGAGGATPGTTRYSSSVGLGTFYEHNGGSVTNSIPGVVYDDDTSTTVYRSVTVYNLPPVLQSITADVVVDPGELFELSASATDPGFDPLTYSWDLDGDGAYDDFFGDAGFFRYVLSGVHLIRLQVSDGDGGYAYGSFNATVTPEPAALAIWSLLGAGGCLGMMARRRRQRSSSARTSMDSIESVGRGGWSAEARQAIYEIIDRGIQP